MSNKLSDKTPEELYYLSKVVDKILAYYDNQMQANEGNYTTAFQQFEYNNAKAKRDLYMTFSESIIEAMENVAISSIADPKQMKLFKTKMEKLENDEKTVDKH